MSNHDFSRLLVENRCALEQEPRARAAVCELTLMYNNDVTYVQERLVISVVEATLNFFAHMHSDFGPPTRIPTTFLPPIPLPILPSPSSDVHVMSTLHLRKVPGDKRTLEP